MYVCPNCGCVFESPKLYSDFQGEVFGAPSYETYTGCPNCGSGYDEAIQCEICGECYPENQIYRGYCEKCANKETNELDFWTKVDLLKDVLYRKDDLLA
jgi:methionyl-tRNA synthetase